MNPSIYASLEDAYDENGCRRQSDPTNPSHYRSHYRTRLHDEF